MTRLFTSVLSLAFIASVASGATAKSCRDAKGHFMKCKTAPMMMKPKQCRDAKGHFMKCGSSSMMHKM